MILYNYIYVMKGHSSPVQCTVILTPRSNGHDTLQRIVFIDEICLIPNTGDITIPGGMVLTVDSDLNGANPQFTLTCISTGGPATTVTWNRDSVTAMGDEMTVLDNAINAQYTHTLTVTGRLGGVYTCTVSNAKPYEAVASFNTQGNNYIH